MNSGEHRRYMASEVWARRKAEYFDRYRKQCVACGTTDGQIDLHHVSYARVPGRERDTDLVPLCAWDHAEVHRLDRTTRKGLVWATRQVTGGQKPWSVGRTDRPKPRKRRHKSDRPRPLVSGFEMTDRTKPSGDVVVSSGKSRGPRRKARRR